VEWFIQVISTNSGVANLILTYPESFVKLVFADMQRTHLKKNSLEAFETTQYLIENCKSLELLKKELVTENLF